ncbi:ABC transporter ATP-binding protein [Prosthecomicrobium sp. N25]|uniref:ABC transporter ATP-binding protein n=1 Tax=Prosthecomicrobium sp. N25 TaxID=3129254 RepID=UPI0030784B88
MRDPATPLLVADRIVKRFPLPMPLAKRLLGRKPAAVGAVEDVSLTVARGETLGVIGESGCGKSTLGRVLLKLHAASSGTIQFDGQDITDLSERQFRPLRRRMQIVFQDPYASLNPRRTVGEIVGLPLRLHEGLGRRDAEERAAEFLPHVGLSARHLRRYPHQFSGGQRQRIGIARALILNPDFVVCDEPVSALDVSIQAQIIELLLRFKAESGLTYLFISHDLAVVGRVSNRIAVMYLGKLVEVGPRDAILRAPAHPYTRALLAAAPRLHPEEGRERIRLVGDLPSPITPPSGCRFHTRCPAAMPVCAQMAPAETEVAPGHRVSCHLHGVSGS